jgi:hypothetical protein
VVQKDDEAEVQQDDPVINITEELLGFAVIDLKPYLLDPELNTLQ